MPKALKWYPPYSGAMQPRSRAKKDGQIVFCGYCQRGIYVKDFGYGLNTKTECIDRGDKNHCNKVLQKNELILDLVKWREFNNLDVNHIKRIRPNKEWMETGTREWYN
tara:strand:- start:405 stop:728 length:324 start_codon:yes stop_codon:yes gene_type:complete